ncbi:MAG: hypothetical protein WC327_07230, partial [Candidatus Cloacimonadia bacterium]
SPYGCSHLLHFHMNGQLYGLDLHQLSLTRLVAHQIAQISQIKRKDRFKGKISSCLTGKGLHLTIKVHKTTKLEG